MMWLFCNIRWWVWSIADWWYCPSQEHPISTKISVGVACGCGHRQNTCSISKAIGSLCFIKRKLETEVTCKCVTPIKERFESSSHIHWPHPPVACVHSGSTWRYLMSHTDPTPLARHALLLSESLPTLQG